MEVDSLFGVGSNANVGRMTALKYSGTDYLEFYATFDKHIFETPNLLI